MEVEFPTSSFVQTWEWPLIQGGRWRKIQIPVRFGFFIHPRMGPTLIDTGYTDRVTSGARSIELRLYCAGFRPRLVQEGQLKHFLRARGLAAEDVRAVILTHFHADHICAARDLPNARFYASGPAYDEVRQWRQLKRVFHGIFLDLLPDDFRERLTAFESAPPKDGPLGLGQCWDLFQDGSVLIVPLPGHAIGHVGVAFPRAERPLLYAADTEWLCAAIPPGRSGIAAKLISHDRVAGKESNARVSQFSRSGGQLVLCHDPELLP